MSYNTDAPNLLKAHINVVNDDTIEIHRGIFASDFRVVFWWMSIAWLIFFVATSSWNDFRWYFFPETLVEEDYTTWQRQQIEDSRPLTFEEYHYKQLLEEYRRYADIYNRLSSDKLPPLHLDYGSWYADIGARKATTYFSLEAQKKLPKDVTSLEQYLQQEYLVFRSNLQQSLWARDTMRFKEEVKEKYDYDVKWRAERREASTFSYKQFLGEHTPREVKENVHFLLGFMGLFFTLANIPRGRPVRFDRRRRIVYFWSWGKFYIHRYPTAALRSQWDFLLALGILESFYETKGSPRHLIPMLAIQLPHEDRESGKTIRKFIGAYARPYELLKNVLYDFANNQCSADELREEIGKARFFSAEFRLSLSFMDLSLFRFGYWDWLTERKIKKWLEKYYNEIKVE